MSKRRVVITGMGAVTPIGNTVAEYKENLAIGTSGAALVTHFDASKFKSKFACEVKNLTVTDFMDSREAKRSDRFTQLAMIAGAEAMSVADFDLEKMDKGRMGVIWGSGIGGLITFQDEVIKFANGDGQPRFNPFFIPKMIIDIAPGLLSIKYGLMGPNYATVSACASASHAILTAYNTIILGQAEMILTGGSEAAIYESGMGGFNALKAMSTRNDDPKTASRPFDKNRDGFVLGEGAGAIVLEELSSAKKRGATIYAELLGGGSSGDAYHMTAPHPEGLGVSLVMENALTNARVNKDEIDYINVHGTSTPLGDLAEIKAIQKVFNQHAYMMNLSSTKSMTGHLLGAAGAIEAIASILSIYHQFVPPTINHFEYDSEIDNKLNLTLNDTQERKLNVVMSNTFGFGGHNASVIFKKFVEY